LHNSKYSVKILQTLIDGAYLLIFSNIINQALRVNDDVCIYDIDHKAMDTFSEFIEMYSLPLTFALPLVLTIPIAILMYKHDQERQRLHQLEVEQAGGLLAWTAQTSPITVNYRHTNEGGNANHLHNQGIRTVTRTRLVFK